MVVGALALGVSVAVTACDGGVPAPSFDSVDVVVDSPELREMKADAGIEDCVPGPADPADRADISGKALPPLTLACLGGGPDVDLASLRGPLLINLWASNCGPCRDEMPALQEFHERHGDVVSLIGIDLEKYPEAAIDFAGATGATYPQLVDPAGALVSQRDLPIRPGLPQFIVVAADGTVVHQSAGGLDSLGEIEDYVTTHLDVVL